MHVVNITHFLARKFVYFKLKIGSPIVNLKYKKVTGYVWNLPHVSLNRLIFNSYFCIVVKDNFSLSWEHVPTAIRKPRYKEHVNQKHFFLNQFSFHYFSLQIYSVYYIVIKYSIVIYSNKIYALTLGGIYVIFM